MVDFETSDALHRRVRAHADAWRACLTGEIRLDTCAAEERERLEQEFLELALSIAQYQCDHAPGFARLVDARGSTLSTLDSIPAVPSDAFRLARVATYPAEFDTARFRTSGTTGSPGIHPNKP